MRLNSNLFRRLPSSDGDKKLFYHLRHTSLPAGTMTEKISAVAESNALKAFVDGDKEMIYLSQRTPSGTRVCSLDFYGNVLENGTFRGQTAHGNVAYCPFSMTSDPVRETRKAITALLGDNALTKIALSGDTALLTAILSNRNVMEIMEFAEELKSFSESQNDWEIRSAANEIVNMAYKLIEERNSTDRKDDESWDIS